MNRRVEPIYKAASDGCRVAEKCTLCPLPVCRYELSQGDQRATINRARDQAISERWWRGATVGELAVQENISERSIHRVLKVQRELVGT